MAVEAEGQKGRKARGGHAAYIPLSPSYQASSYVSQTPSNSLIH